MHACNRYAIGHEIHARLTYATLYRSQSDRVTHLSNEGCTRFHFASFRFVFLVNITVIVEWLFEINNARVLGWVWDSLSRVSFLREIASEDQRFIDSFSFLVSEIAKVRASLFQISGVKKEPLVLPEPDGDITTLTEKVYVPVKEHPDVSIVNTSSVARTVNLTNTSRIIFILTKIQGFTRLELTKFFEHSKREIRIFWNVVSIRV